MVVKNLTKTFGGVRALNNVSMSLSGGITLVMGPNGSGKTTLINCISGIYKPDSGKIEYNGIDITGKPPHEIVRYGIVHTFQIPSPFKRLSVLENLMVSAQNNRGEKLLRSIFKREWIKEERENFEKSMEILELLNLDHLYDQPAFVLSGGQLKLLEIGRALMTNAKLILMDEPVGGVNPVLAHQIFSHLRKIMKEMKIAFLVVEHRLDVAIKYVDYVYAMAEGKIISHGPPEKVVSDETVTKTYLSG
ncbi:MAG: ABC transporter ATP-binding protein [Candidatus Bathyarchaeia archaeon]